MGNFHFKLFSVQSRIVYISYSLILDIHVLRNVCTDIPESMYKMFIEILYIMAPNENQTSTSNGEGINK